MNYYLDFEFITGKIPYKLCGINFKNNNISTQPISIGLFCEDGREYYAIFNDFNLDYAWNEFEESLNKNYNTYRDESHYNPMYIKDYWIRENVLKPIYDELFIKVVSDDNMLTGDEYVYFNYSNLKTLIKRYGKSKEQIAEEIKEFVNLPKGNELQNIKKEIKKGYDANLKGFKKEHLNWTSIKFYCYYSSFDFYLFCNLFCGMLNLPKGFPKYCIDLKQELDKTCELYYKDKKGLNLRSIKDNLELLKEFRNYPKENNIHNALKDAKWNLELHKFIKAL